MPQDTLPPENFLVSEPGSHEPAINETPEVKSWDDFVDTHSKISLLQSWTWGEFQKSVGRQIERLSIIDKEGNIRAVALLVLIKLPLGLSYAYCPRGPVVRSQNKDRLDKIALKKIHELIIKKARSWRAVFVRIDPPLPPSAFEFYQALGYRPAASQIQPKVTARLDLTKDREQLLADMKSKTRYNIRLAVRKKIIVQNSVNAKDIEAFLKLNQETTRRDNFYPHPDNYYRRQFNLLGKKGFLRLFVASYQNVPLAIIAVAWHGGTAIYLHGTSSNRERNRMPTFLAQWEAIKFLQDRNLKWYDFHGVAPNDNPAHPWAGITRFKLGFGAKRLTFMGALDLPLRPFWYHLYNTRLKFRKSDGR